MKLNRARLPSIIVSVSMTCLSGLSFGANIGVCNTDVENLEGMSSKEFYSASGELRLLIVSDSALNSNQCESTSLPQAATSILWSALLPAQLDLSAQNQVILQGSFALDATAISEIIVPEPIPSSNSTATASTDPVDNPSSEYDSVLFGIEERARWTGGTQLECLAGDQVAGLQLKTNEQWPQSGRVQIKAAGTGEFRIAMADEQHIENEATVAAGTLRLNGETSMATHYFPLPENSTPWQAITFLCPQTAAILHIDSIELQAVTEFSSNSSRTAWLWNPTTWQHKPNFFWTIQSLENIEEFYITVPVNAAGEVSNAAELTSFIAEANERGIRIWAVIGDRRDLLPESLAPLQARISAYRRYNTRVAENEQLAGVQLDIEPYLLPGYTLAPDLWRERYLQTIGIAKRSAGESLHVDLVMPVWWGDHVNWGPKLLDELTLPGISLTIMNYRTDYEQLLSGMTPFLEWGVRNQQEVRVALETGSLGDETQRAYGLDEEEGELWNLQIGSTPMLVLFDQPQRDLAGQAYSQRFERVFSADNLTFNGDQQRLNEISNRLSDELSTWTSFSGIALHGLDEIYADHNNE